MRDLRHAFMVRVLLSVLQFRFNQRYVAGTPPFRSIEFDHSDSGREGCAVSTLTITSEPRDWRGAVQVAVEEVRKLQLYGVTAGELERYKSALLKDSEQLAEQAGSVPSVENLDFTMDSLAQGHVVMDQKQVCGVGWGGWGGGGVGGWVDVPCMMCICNTTHTHTHCTSNHTPTTNTCIPTQTIPTPHSPTGSRCHACSCRHNLPR